MKLDKARIERLLRLNDDQLREFLKKVGQEAGVDIGGIPIDTDNMQKLRQILAAATDEDIQKAADELAKKGILPKKH